MTGWIIYCCLSSGLQQAIWLLGVFVEGMMGMAWGRLFYAKLPWDTSPSGAAGLDGVFFFLVSPIEVYLIAKLLYAMMAVYVLGWPFAEEPLLVIPWPDRGEPYRVIRIRIERGA